MAFGQTPRGQELHRRQCRGAHGTSWSRVQLPFPGARRLGLAIVPLAAPGLGQRLEAVGGHVPEQDQLPLIEPASRGRHKTRAATGHQDPDQAPLPETGLPPRATVDVPMDHPMASTCRSSRTTKRADARQARPDEAPTTMRRPTPPPPAPDPQHRSEHRHVCFSLERGPMRAT